MKSIIAAILLASVAQAAITIRVTDDSGNVAVANVTATNRVAAINEWINEHAPGTNTTAKKLADLCEQNVRAWAFEAKRNKVRAAKDRDTEAALGALQE